jgi:membrane protein
MIPAVARVAGSVLQFLKLMDEKGREDKVFLLAGGIAFNLLLALIPLLVVTITVAALLLGQTGPTVPDMISFLSELIPVGPETASILEARLQDVLNSAPTAASVGTIAFIWLATRLFGSLRVVLADVFDIEETRNLIRAKLFDIRITMVSSVFITAYFVITAYLDLATVRGGTALSRLNLPTQFVGELEYYIARVIAFAFILLTFLLLYRYLPRKRVRWRTAAVAALFTSVMFEVARYVFAKAAPLMNPGSIYSGVIAAVVVAVLWSYYVALIFILGGEVAQVWDLMRARRIQKVVFE